MKIKHKTHTITRKCRWCLKDISDKHPNAKYCSNDCGETARLVLYINFRMNEWSNY